MIDDGIQKRRRLLELKWMMVNILWVVGMSSGRCRGEEKMEAEVEVNS